MPAGAALVGLPAFFSTTIFTLLTLLMVVIVSALMPVSDAFAIVINPGVFAFIEGIVIVILPASALTIAPVIAAAPPQPELLVLLVLVLLVLAVHPLLQAMELLVVSVLLAMPDGLLVAFAET